MSGSDKFQWGSHPNPHPLLCILLHAPAFVGAQPEIFSALVFLAPGTTGQRPQAARHLADTAGVFAAWAWEGWGRVGVSKRWAGLQDGPMEFLPLLQIAL